MYIVDVHLEQAEIFLRRNHAHIFSAGLHCVVMAYFFLTFQVYNIHETQCNILSDT